jgi:MoxR-like ATPase
MTNQEIKDVEGKISSITPSIKKLIQQVSSIVTGQEKVVEQVIIALLCDGHVLIEGVPGLGKTLLVKTLAHSLQASYGRIQFTPDLLPADVTGTLIYNPQKSEFSIKKGPVFTNILLGDEINRAPAKVQSALLEAMQERQVTIGETSFDLPKPFIVLATQNPVDQQGTYPLPEAQLDRFFMKVLVDYPDRYAEKEIIKLLASENGAKKQEVLPCISLTELQNAKQIIKQVFMEDNIAQYIVNLINATRKVEGSPIANGISPRGSINMAIAAKCQAFLQGRGYVIPDDVKSVFVGVCRHRISLFYDALADGLTADKVLENILRNTIIP